MRVCVFVCISKIILSYKIEDQGQQDGSVTKGSCQVLRPEFSTWGPHGGGKEWITCPPNSTCLLRHMHVTPNHHTHHTYTHTHPCICIKM